MLRETASKAGAFPEQNCNGVMVMQQGTGGEGCLCGHSRSPQATLTRRRGVYRATRRAISTNQSSSVLAYGR